MPKSINPLQQRRASSLSQLKRTKPSATPTSREKLDDVGTAPLLSPAGVRQDVVCLIQHIRANTFGGIPERAGINSTQISSTLRFRASLPPIVSLAHLYALSASPTSTERELARLVAQGRVRKVNVPGRGKGGAAVGEGVVLVEEWKACVRENTSLSQELKGKYTALLDSHPTISSVATASLDDDEVRQLVTAGFLTSPAALSASLGDLFASPSSAASLLNVASAGSKAATGTLAAVGGSAAIHDSGGGGSSLATSSTRPAPGARGADLRSREMTFSLPNTGAYLKLLISARAHLAHLLKQLSPRWREAAVHLLREKWDGSLGNAEVRESKRARGEGGPLLPGRTKRWREFMGLEFDFVLAESVGSGSVELFGTGSVGVAARMR